jgi:hypothetical protein
VPGRDARVPVQSNQEHAKPAGTIAWWEHEQAWTEYARRYGRGQSAWRIAERHGFCYGELVELLGHEPETWLRRESPRYGGPSIRELLDRARTPSAEGDPR